MRLAVVKHEAGFRKRRAAIASGRQVGARFGGGFAGERWAIRGLLERVLRLPNAGSTALAACLCVPLGAIAPD